MFETKEDIETAAKIVREELGFPCEDSNSLLRRDYALQVWGMVIYCKETFCPIAKIYNN